MKQVLETGQPMRFGKSMEKGIRLNGLTPEVVDVADVDERQLLVHDERAAEPTLAYLLSRDLFVYETMADPNTLNKNLYNHTTITGMGWINLDSKLTQEGNKTRQIMALAKGLLKVSTW